MKYHTHSSYNGYSVRASEDMKARVDILNAIICSVEFMASMFSRVLFIRFDLRYPSSYCAKQTNDDLSKFLNSFSTYLSRNGLHYQYVWAREQLSGSNQHYHVMLLLNGNKTRNSYGHLLKADELWQRAIGFQSAGLLHHCKPSVDIFGPHAQVMLDRNDPLYIQHKDACIEWASYLAKVYTKGCAPPRVHEWSTSSMD